MKYCAHLCWFPYCSQKCLPFCIWGEVLIHAGQANSSSLSCVRTVSDSQAVDSRRLKHTVPSPHRNYLVSRELPHSSSCSGTFHTESWMCLSQGGVTWVIFPLRLRFLGVFCQPLLVLVTITCLSLSFLLGASIQPVLCPSPMFWGFYSPWWLLAWIRASFRFFKEAPRAVFMFQTLQQSPETQGRFFQSF